MSSMLTKFKRYFGTKLSYYFGTKLSYQDKRNSEQNWQLIKSQIGDDKSVLDVACDSGFYSLKFAEMGMFVIGFDILAKSLKKAKALAVSKNIDNVKFFEMSLTPDNVLKLPSFDSVLCLSVFHHFFRLYGEDQAKEMLRSLFKISKKQLYIQIPSKIGKYDKTFSIDFKGDKELTEKYIRDIFSNVTDSAVTYVGKKSELPPTENYRYLFLVTRV